MRIDAQAATTSLDVTTSASKSLTPTPASVAASLQGLTSRVGSLPTQAETIAAASKRAAADAGFVLRGL